MYVLVAFFSLLPQITFYEDKNFQGRSYECSTDCSDIQMHLNRCNSCRVDNGCFVVYDRSNFLGNQVFLRRGEYPDFQRMGSMMGMIGMAMMDNIRSCRMIPMVRHFYDFLLALFTASDAAIWLRTNASSLRPTAQGTVPDEDL